MFKCPSIHCNCQNWPAAAAVFAECNSNCLLSIYDATVLTTQCLHSASLTHSTRISGHRWMLCHDGSLSNQSMSQLSSATRISVNMLRNIYFSKCYNSKKILPSYCTSAFLMLYFQDILSLLIVPPVF